MRFNNQDHPNVLFASDIDGTVHIVDTMGGTWCEDEDVELEDSAPQPKNPIDLCDGCLTSARDEGLVEGD